ncbi:MAG: M1 family aminopeptidase [Mahellales bacterium]
MGKYTKGIIKQWVAMALLCFIMIVGSGERVRADSIVTYADNPLKDSPIYNMYIDLDLDNNRLHGVTSITFVNKNASCAVLWFQLYQNDTGSRLMDIETITINDKGVDFTYYNNLVAIYSPVAIDKGERVSVTFTYTAQIQECHDQYTFYGLKDGIFALSRFYPSLVPQMDNGWLTTPNSEIGDPFISDAGYFDVVIKAPITQTVLASGEVARAVVSGNKQLIRVLAGPARTFSIVSCDKFGLVTGKHKGIKIISAYKKGNEKGGLNNLIYTKKALDTFQRLLGKYPYDYIYVCQAPIRSSGMEYSGMIWISRARMEEGGSEATVVHEVAHQWWFNSVGSDEYREPWLDESLARYCEVLYYEKNYGPSHGKTHLQNMEQGYIDMTNGQMDMKLGMPLDKYDGDTYFPIVYEKGAMFQHQLRNAMGSKQYLKALSKYYKKYMWKIATTKDFENTMKEYSREDVSLLFDRWVYQQGTNIRGEKLVVTGSTLPVFNSPDAKSVKISLLSDGAIVTAVEKRGDWLKIVTPRGNRGYVYYKGMKALR